MDKPLKYAIYLTAGSVSFAALASGVYHVIGIILSF